MTDLPYPHDATYLTVKEVAVLFRVSTKTVRRWIADRSLQATRIGREWRIQRCDLARLAEDRGNTVLRHAL